MSLVLRLGEVTTASSGPRPANEQVQAGAGVRHEIRVDDGGGTHVLAYPERNCAPGDVAAYRKDRKQGVRHFILWQDRYRQRQLALVATQSGATKSRADYIVRRPTGEVIATVSVDKASLSAPHRTRWTIRQNGHPAAVGRKGQVGWWLVWWLLFPLQVLLAVASLLSDSSGGDLVHTPRRTIWRVDGNPVLDYGYKGNNYHLLTRWLDPTIAAAVVALHRSHPSWFDPAWDEAPPP